MQFFLRALILTVLVFLPTYVVRFSVGPLPTTLLEVIFLSLFFVWGAEKIYYRREGQPRDASRSPIGALRAPIILFLLASIPAILIAPDLRAALGLWRAYIIEPLLFFVIVLDIVRRGWSTFLRDTTAALAVSATVVSIIGIAQWFFPAGIFGFFAIPNPYWAAEATRRVTSVFGFPNAVGLFLAPLVVFFVARAFAFVQHRAMRVALVIVAILATTAIVLARSEGALIALDAGLFTLGVLHVRTRRVTIIVAIIAATVFLAIPTTRTYFLDRAQLKSESGPVRLLQWRETVAMLRDRPILGAGFSGYPTTVAPYHTAEGIEIYQYPHNIVLNFWSEMGVFGAVAFGWIIIALLRMAFVRRDATGTMVIAMLVVILVHGIVDVPYFKNDLAMFFWFFAAILVISRENGMMDSTET